MPVRAGKLDALCDATCLTLVHPPHEPGNIAALNASIYAAGLAPEWTAPWRERRDRVLALKGTIPADGLVVVGETWMERDWCIGAKLAGYLPSDRYFGT